DYFAVHDKPYSANIIHRIGDVYLYKQDKIKKAIDVYENLLVTVLNEVAKRREESEGVAPPVEEKPEAKEVPEAEEKAKPEEEPKAEERPEEEVEAEVEEKKPKA
ncbi:unnamed protein product, partial [marine sediment metagenome]